MGLNRELCVLLPARGRGTLGTWDEEGGCLWGQGEWLFWGDRRGKGDGALCGDKVSAFRDKGMSVFGYKRDDSLGGREEGHAGMCVCKDKCLGGTSRTGGSV